MLLAIVLSLLDHLRRGYRPNDTVVVHRPDGSWQAVPAATGGEAEPGLVVYRFAASLYYANANHLQEELRALASADPPPAWIAIDCSAIADVDFTGGETLKTLHAELAADGQRLVLTRVSDDVRAELDRYGVTELLGPDAVIDDSSDELLDLFRRAAPARPATKG